MNTVNGYKQRVIRISKYTAILLIIFLVGVFTPLSNIFLGLLVGTTVSLINTVFTAWKINIIGGIAATASSHDNRRASAGMLTRIALSVLAIMVAMEYPDYFNIYSTLIGLFIVQVITVVDGIIYKF